MSFDSLRGLPERLYRGISHPMAVQLARDVGVGPFRELADAALKQGKAADDPVYEFLSASLKKMLERQRQLVGYMPPAWTKQDQLRALVGIVGGIAVGSVETADHVLHDYDALLSPDVGRSTDSATHSPKVAILYAYGIKTDDFFENRTVTFYSGKPTTAPHVALLVAGTKGQQVDNPAFDRLKFWYQHHHDPNVRATVDEVKKRVTRDEERLLREVARVDKLVDLPPFDVADAVRSLDVAAEKLRTEGVAQ
ncbi:hypothetical protein WMF37_25990 [Sorangium sp. So ce291]|uniref:hypothetical protein n=1 Tax=Sorangium sp. So ce291 TaxID=3133294 RepID=UPI003F61B722